MDINSYLKQVTTAPVVDPVGSAEPWGRGKKRHGERDANADPHTRTPRTEPAVGLNLEELQTELAKERHAAAQEARRRDVGSAHMSAQESAKRAHLILEYVMTRERGGRHNARRGGVDGPTGNEGLDAPPALSRLAAERARLCPAAAYDIQHLVHEAADGVGAYSEVHRTRAADGVVAYRKGLGVCDQRTDLVGGVTSGMAPHLRAHALRVVEAGLRGEAWVRQTTEAGEAQPSAAVPKESPLAAPLMLFGDDTEPAKVPEEGDGAAEPTFSLDQFLNGGDEDDDDEDDA